MRRSRERWDAKTARSGPTFYKIGARLWRHPSVFALVREYGNPVDPAAIVREKARQLVSDAKDHGWTGPPFDPRSLASLLGIKARPDQLGSDHDAFIYPANGQQLEIVFDLACPSTRQNFSICHEIAHTFFPAPFGRIRTRSQP
jgi:hypothetical protein